MFSQYFLNHLFASKTNSFKASVQHIFLYELFEFRKLNNIVFFIDFTTTNVFSYKDPISISYFFFLYTKDYY